MKFPKLRIKERIKNLFSKVINKIKNSRGWKILIFIGMPVNLTFFTWFSPAWDWTSSTYTSVKWSLIDHNDYALVKEFKSDSVYDSLDYQDPFIKRNYDGTCEDIHTFEFMPGQRVVIDHFSGGWFRNQCARRNQPYAIFDSTYWYNKFFVYTGVAGWRIGEVEYVYRDSIAPIYTDKGEIAKLAQVHRALKLKNIGAACGGSSTWLLSRKDLPYQLENADIEGECSYNWNVSVYDVFQVYEPILDDELKSRRKRQKVFGLGLYRMPDPENKWWWVYHTDKFGWNIRERMFHLMGTVSADTLRKWQEEAIRNRVKNVM